MIGTGVIDVLSPLDGFDFDAAAQWHVLVLCGGAPAARVDLPSPGTVAGNALVEAALGRRADAERARLELIERLRERLGTSLPEPAPPRVSMVVCTHRRSSYLNDLVASVGRLDPPPFEVIVVDNDPGAEDCRERVERAGLRYVREDRRGLDNGRNAGVRAARGDVVLFTDDDCVLAPGWLRPLARAFAEEAVTAVTGPAFPYLLDTPARVRMEHQASLARGLQRVSFDWETISPLHAAAMGVGANMAVRRDRLLRFGQEPFPPELDAGTETESGGDSYLLGRLLAAGDRVVYDPAMFVFHQHRPDGPALRRAVLGYGIGLSAALTKLVVERRELSAPRAWAWLPKQYLKTQRRRAVGRADAVETRISWDYLRGGFLGARRWRVALRTQAAAAGSVRAEPDPEPLGDESKDPVAAVAPAPTRGTPPALSVIVPTFRRAAALRHCLRALAAQDAAPGSFEVIVVDDDPDTGLAAAGPSPGYPFALRRIRNGGSGAAAARNHGAAAAAAPLLLFLDDDVVADPGLVRAHLDWHREHQQEVVLVGPYRPRPSRRNLAAQAARLWWQDLFSLLADAREPTFIAALTANVSLAQTLFERSGGFSERYSRQRREDWEWGLRLRRAGIPIRFEPRASARHEFTLGTAQRLRDARREGVGDTLIVADFPEALPSLPLSLLRMPTRSQPLRRAGLWLWGREPVRAATIALLDLLEAARLREAWGRVFRRAQASSYALGAGEGGWRSDSAAAIVGPPALELELASERPLPPPPVAAQLLRVTLDGELVAEVFPREGVWAPPLAEQIVDAIKPETVMRAAALDGVDGTAASGHEGEVEVLLGPASPASDRRHVEALAATGAAVRVLEGEPSGHWDAVVAAAAEAGRPLLALPLPGTAPDSQWLADALAAFDGDRVGLVFGGRVEAGEHARPLYLHDRDSADVSLVLSAPGPAYLVARRELLVGLMAGAESLEWLVGALGRALDEGWVIGHRDARGLAAPLHSHRELARAFGRVEAERQLRTAPGRPLAVLARAASRGGLTLGWLAFKRRGRLSSRQRALSLGTVEGAAAALRQEARRAEPPSAQARR